jgi:glutamate/tyrosine decarboxylase-like PLP-dependent enzyme
VQLPQTGRSAADVLAEIESFKAGDKDFSHGRTFGLVFHAGHDIEEVGRQAHESYLWYNALNPDAFPSLRRMQSDVVSMAASMVNGDEQTAGFMTSGGTESLLMAVKAAKVRGAKERDIHDGNVVMPTSAHAAFDKGCEYFGVEPRRVDVCDDFRADPDAMADAIDDRTVLVVASAPQYPQGVIDPVPDVAALAHERDISCHVDACMGGFMLPFLERAGIDIPLWDFRVAGVTSISADIHKYGYVPKGASVILHRTKELRNNQVFMFDGWLGGMYASSGVLGTKPGGPIAAAWATMQYLGEDGYERCALAAYDARRRLVEGVRALPGLAIVGEPDVTLCAITKSGTPFDLDVFAVGAELSQRGWLLDRQGPPESLHATCTPVHADYIDDFLEDLRQSIAAVAGVTLGDRSTNYAVLE